MSESTPKPSSRLSISDAGSRNVLKSVSRVAGRALCHALAAAVELEYRLHRFVISTAGAKVMRGLAIPGRFFYAKCESSRVVLDQIVTGKIAIAFFKFSHLFFKITNASQCRGLALGGLNAILLHGQYLSPEMHELNRKFIGSRRDLRFIERLHSRFVSTDSVGNASQVANNVHGGLPIGESSGVGTTDSTDLEIPDPTPPDQDNKILIGPTDI